MIIEEANFSESLIIDLNNAQQATALDASAILHKKQVRTLVERIGEIVGRVDKFKENLKAPIHDISYERYHDVITVHGKRGSGKTTFLLSVLKLLKDGEKLKKFADQEFIRCPGNMCVLGILDPTLFAMREHLLFALLSKVEQMVCDHTSTRGISLCNPAMEDCRLEKWKKQLHMLAKGLKSIGEMREDQETPPESKNIWEDAEFRLEQGMDNALHGIGLERQFHAFLATSLELLGKTAFVLALDDIDTRPVIGWHVLEVLRKYFTSPQLVVILSGDFDLFTTIIRKKQLEIFGLNFTSAPDVLEEFKEKVDGLTEQFLLKILRTSTRIHLGSFQMALQQWKKYGKEAKAVIRKGGKEEDLSPLLHRLYEILNCNTGGEQKLFRQALFANPSRTVVQILDSLPLSGPDGSHPDGFSLDILTRLREVFMVPLQNLGFEHPFDLAEELTTTRGVTLLMEQLFTRGYISQGLEMLPSRSDIFENNALLALQAELTQAMGNNPVVVWAYAFKACLLREVLHPQDIPMSKQHYAEIQNYLALEVEGPLYQTASRIAAMLWPDLNSGTRPVRRTGTLRLYGRSLAKDASKAIPVMYGMSKERVLSEPSILKSPGYHKDFGPMAEFAAIAEKSGLESSKILGRWINTPETLANMITSWQKDFVLLSIFEVGKGGFNSLMISIFPLLALMGDMLACESAGDISSLLAKSSQIQRIPIFHNSPNRESTPIEELEEDKDDLPPDYSALSEKESSRKTLFINGLYEWVKSVQLLPASATLLARIQHRFFMALERIDAEFSEKKTFAGTYLHRCIVVFLNSVLVEEFLHNKKDKEDHKVTLEHPTMSDKVFLYNIKTTEAIGLYKNEKIRSFEQRRGKGAAVFRQDVSASIGGEQVSVHGVNPRYPLFKEIFSCPLWGMYLNPEETSQGEYSNTVYGIYMQLQESVYADFVEDDVSPFGIHRVFYGKAADVPNLFPLLNSLAIPKNPAPTFTAKELPPESSFESFVERFTQSAGTSLFDSLTQSGRKLGLSPRPVLPQYAEIIDDVFVNAPELLEQYVKGSARKKRPDDFPRICESIINRYYRRHHPYVDAVLHTDIVYRGFWNALKERWEKS